MKRKTLIFGLLICTIPLATSVNLQMSLDTPEKVLYPNESIQTNISVSNLDTRAAEDTQITLEVGQRNFTYDADTIEPGENFSETLELPPYPAGSYQAKMTANYSGLLGERFTETTRSGFKVRFPEFVEIPRYVYIQDLKMPENVTAGDKEEVNALIKNDGDIGGDFTAAVVSQDSQTEKEFALSPQNQENITIKPKFYTAGVSFAETRLYANLNDDLFLLDYISDQVFVEEKKVANIEIGNLKATSEKNDAEIKLEIKNKGPDAAYEARINLNSSLISESKNLGVINSGELAQPKFTVRNPSKEHRNVNFTVSTA